MAVDTPLQGQRLWLPSKLRIQDGYLVWEYLKQANSADFTSRWSEDPSTGILSEFCAINTDRDVLHFARKWGILKIATSPEGKDATTLGFHPLERYSENRESLQIWHAMVQRFRSILALAGQLPQIGNRADWKIIGHRRAPESVGFAYRLLEFEVNHWIVFGGVRIRLTTDINVKRGRYEWGVEIGYGCFDVVGALAVQSMLAIAGAYGLFICDGCRLPQLVSRQPRTGLNNYCVSCGRTRAVKDADRRRKEKMRRARALFAEGVTVLEIATRLDSSEETISRWVKGGGREQ